MAPRSPLTARALEDAAYLRAIFGSVSLLTLAIGLALGIAAVTDTAGEALPPIAALTIAIAVIGVLDAAAGLVAVGAFTIGVLLLGGVDSNADVRTLVGLSALWFAVPILAGAARPLRRLPAAGLGPTFDRGADFVIASLIGAWVVYEIVGALPGLAGLDLPIADHATAAAIAVLVALVARMGIEELAAHLYPKRLAVAEADELPEPGRLQQLGAVALRGRCSPSSRPSSSARSGSYGSAPPCSSSHSCSRCSKISCPARRLCRARCHAGCSSSC